MSSKGKAKKEKKVVKEKKVEPQYKQLKFQLRDVVKSKNVKTTRFQVSKKNDQPLSLAEVQNLMTTLHDSFGDDADIMIRGVNIDKWSTIQDFDGRSYLDDLDDYLDRNGSVKDKIKFQSFSQLHIYVRKQN